jgi:hypothetical protein
VAPSIHAFFNNGSIDFERKNYMKKLLSTVIGLCLFVVVNQASAVTLSLLPETQTATSGDMISLDLVIDGLGDFAPDSLGAFDVDITYDTSLLSFQSYSLGWDLGDLSLFEAIDTSGGEGNPGVIDIAEISLLSSVELDAMQSSGFILASLDFSVDALMAGNSTTVSIDPLLMLSDGFGNLLTLEGTTDALISAPVPVPSTLILFSSGLLFLGVARKYSGNS